ncbi:MAG: hypothetical protein IJP62_03360 [Treponema sp.]|nr:hypothetical protein [Treponema sp.]
MNNEQIISLMRQRLIFLLMKISGEPQEINRTIEQSLNDYMQPTFSFEKLSSFFTSCDELELQLMGLKQGFIFPDKTDVAMDILSKANLILKRDFPQ